MSLSAGSLDPAASPQAPLARRRSAPPTSGGRAGFSTRTAGWSLCRSFCAVAGGARRPAGWALCCRSCRAREGGHDRHVGGPRDHGASPGRGIFRPGQGPGRSSKSSQDGAAAQGRACQAGRDLAPQVTTPVDTREDIAPTIWQPFRIRRATAADFCESERSATCASPCRPVPRYFVRRSGDRRAISDAPGEGDRGGVRRSSRAWRSSATS